MNIGEIITKMGFGNQAVITAFKHEDDDSDYAVWKIAMLFGCSKRQVSKN